ncbi:MAG: glycosyltransferase [Dechloromonas sp.]|nr:glycosyltransferase [Dechloromonas sp.]
MKILFFSECVTLAHLARPLVLAGAAAEAGHQVTIARSEAYAAIAAHYPFASAPLDSIAPRQFAAALASGSPLYDAATLERYVADDLRLIERIRPDVVVGDFRLSLSVSARLAGVPYTTLTNAYWSPYGTQRYTVPTLPLTRFLPIGMADALFNLARPFAFRYHALALNRVRRRHGLPSLGLDLRRVYTDADTVLYVDHPALFPLAGAPESHSFIGPILWSPPGAPPPWWDALPPDRPIVYATPGSSGHAALLATVIEALAPLPVSIIAASAGQATRLPAAPKLFLADYLPGTEAARRAALVVCNGGSPTCQQALAAGVPVLGIPTNLDQFLNMAPIAATGAGALLRADRVEAKTLRATAERLLNTDPPRAAARGLAAQFREYSAPERFLASLPLAMRQSTSGSQG